MPLVQVGSFADSQSRSDNSRILSETDIARLKRGGYLITASAQQRALLEELEAMAVFVDHLPKLSKLGPIELGENSTVYSRDCTKKPCKDEALGVIARVENRVSVRWKDIAPTMRSATVAVEDKRYWEHGALD